MTLEQCDPQNYDENLLKNTDNHLKLIIFLTFLSNFQEKHRFQASSLSAEDKTQVYKYNTNIEYIITFIHIHFF